MRVNEITSSGIDSAGEGAIVDNHGVSYDVYFTPAAGHHQATYRVLEKGKASSGLNGGVAAIASMGSKNSVSSINVFPNYARRGIATALYDLIEMHRGKPLTPNWALTADGEAFWQARKNE